MEYLDWFVRVLVAGVAIWALRGYLSERTEKHRAGDQPLTSDEITKRCIKEHLTLKEAFTVEVSHVHELVKKDLEAGSRQMATHTAEIKGLARDVKDVVGGMRELTGALERNGHVKPWDGKERRG